MAGVEKQMARAEIIHAALLAIAQKRDALNPARVSFEKRVLSSRNSERRAGGSS